MTWNIQDGGLDKESGSDDRFWQQMGIICDLAPDILCVQEARWWTDRKFALLLAFENATGLRPFLGMAMSGFHTVVAVRPGMVRPVGHETDDRIHHVHNKLTVELAGYPDPVVVVSSHLTPFDGSSREIEAARVADLAERSSLLCGDMNCVGPDDEPVDLRPVPLPRRSHHTMSLVTDHLGLVDPAQLPVDDRRAVARLCQAGFLDTIVARPDPNGPIPATAGHAADGSGLPRRCDHILISPHLTPSLVRGSYQVLDNSQTRQASDHLPVTVELAF